MSDAINHARSIAVTLLNLQPYRTPDVIRAQVKLAAQTTKAAGLGDVDVEALVAQLMHEANVYVPDAMLMDDPDDHFEWLLTHRGSIKWNFWSRYKAFLEQEKKLPEPVVNSLDKLTDEILGKTENPNRPPPWDCRGMVVGSVQSGKTANYCGLICKAIDAGYRLIIVLAGMHDNLRSQTQFRIDEGVLGRDSQKDRQLNTNNSLIGVGRMFGEAPTIHTLTTSLDKGGDFKAPKAETGVSIGGDPVVLVVKKNSGVLKNVFDWATKVGGENRADGKGKIVRHVPLLLIDDEADNASINTKDRKRKDADPNDVTAINGRIRDLLNAFEKSAYIGYTATPFANIFINHETDTEKHGEDLFPRSFILNVSPPSNYISPSRVFGLDGDLDSGIDPKQALPLFRQVKDHEKIFVPKHKKDLVVSELPPSLKKALHCFVLVCAARRARCQANVHNSMLVHVTRFVDVQKQVADLIQLRVDSIRRRLEIGEGARRDTLLTDLKNLWESEFVPTTKAIREMAPDEYLPEISWLEVATELPEATSRIVVKEINGHATDALDYVAHKDGFNVVAVGGDKLSRGLTLEGLSVSYFLRASQMYDTLMQMGRWFGYRPGYMDLCRLFTTDDLRKWYRHIALAEVELRREFDRMKYAGLTPRRYGLRVREHPGGLLITALNKMAHGQTQKLSYAGQLVQTAHFSTDIEQVTSNKQTVDSLVHLLGGAKTALQERGTAILWMNVKPIDIIDGLLTNYSVVSESWKFQKAELMEYIRHQNDVGELVNWTVALVNTQGVGPDTTFSDCTVRAAQRTPEKETWPADSIPPLYVAPNSNIQSPAHQALDLMQLVINEAILTGLLSKRLIDSTTPLFDLDEQEILKKCCTESKTLGVAAQRLTEHLNLSAANDVKHSAINGEVARNLRPVTHGLLLIYPLVPLGRSWSNDKPFTGLAVSFPSSHTARAVDYRVNKVWRAILPDDNEYGD